MDNKNYHIKDKYQARREPMYHDESSTSDEVVGPVYQPDVYQIAAGIARRLGKERIVDIGCGCAAKLAELQPEFEIVGIDFGPNIEFCRSAYPFGNWLELNFETPGDFELEASLLRSSVLVCGDVIEHLIDPAPLLAKFRDWMPQAGALILSTPDRNLKNGMQDGGPPENPHHVREWSLPELTAWMRSMGFELAYAGLTRTHNGSPARNTILIVARGFAKSQADLVDDLYPPRVARFAYWARVLRKTIGVWRKA